MQEKVIHYDADPEDMTGTSSLLPRDWSADGESKSATFLPRDKFSEREIQSRATVSMIWTLGASPMPHDEVMHGCLERPQFGTSPELFPRANPLATTPYRRSAGGYGRTAGRTSMWSFGPPGTGGSGVKSLVF